MKTVVTGGAGFVGSHLVEHLLDSGDDVVVLDNLSTGTLDNLATVAGHKNFRFVEGTVTDRRCVHDVMAGVDRVFHLAAAVGVRLIVDRPLESLRTNIHGTENVLDAALEAGADMLLVSTSEIYGKNTSDSLHEDSDRILGSPLISRWTYAAAKGIDEAFAHAYWRELGLDVAIVRLFNTVGPRQTGRYGMVVPNLVQQALNGEPLTVFGDGRQTRCFSYVGDVVPSIVRILETPESFGRAFNLGGSQEISILDLARRIIELTGSPSPVTLVPYSQAYPAGYEDMRRRVPDNTRSRDLVGFRPTTTVDEIILHITGDLKALAPAVH
ncbi:MULTISPECIES: NAD-dependent epimerase/dehydratase family protein [Rhodococcus]|uniref:NAD-dependent epimerase/dehydratase family protein n=1 Tax=Rhodococcus TaxID=1827 RepID=UPI00156213C7|nr:MULTISPECIES: NAD-dependent epimerase/dehydratase family protein [Rhodococcus]NRI65448.1 NAD-dependent epimerase/dehydratase family protein [Rhodococcus sp. MS16]QXW01377.1 GDP-mannose 4,6-dehydratase [Rhodococcus globerulus]